MTIRQYQKQTFLYPATSEKYQVELSLFKDLFERYGKNARKIQTNPFDWRLPAMGDPYPNCGAWRARGCLAQHYTADGSGAYIKLYHRNCSRKDCPVCYQAWCLLLANRAIYRILSIVSSVKKAKELCSIENHRKRERAIQRYFNYLRENFKVHIDHVIVSVPDKYLHLDYKELKKKVSKVLKNSGLQGYLSIFHPFRKNKNGWYYSPHFHLIARGFIKRQYERDSFVVRKLPRRESYLGTIAYQLSHAGVKTNRHVTTWHGAFSYNKARIPKFVMPKPTCPYCNEQLEPLIYLQGELTEIINDVEESKYLNPRLIKNITFFDSPSNWMKKGSYFG